jgi:uncharacterized protein YutE (UPF0331/DUF86 family)
MLLMDLIGLSVKLASRIGATEDAMAHPLEFLREQEVISRTDLAAIQEQREVRNTSQHIYVELSMSALRSAVLQQIETTPRLIRDVVKWVETTEEIEGRFD